MPNIMATWMFDVGVLRCLLLMMRGGLSFFIFWVFGLVLGWEESKDSDVRVSHGSLRYSAQPFILFRLFFLFFLFRV